MLKISLKNTPGFTYLTDAKGIIVACNDHLIDFLEVQIEAVIGQYLSALPIYRGYIIDNNNRYLLLNKLEYADFIEVFLMHTKKHNVIPVVSSKRLLFNQDQEIVGLLNESLPIKENTKYDPHLLYSINNHSIAYEIKENLNALYTFNKQLQLITPHLAQECAIDNMDRIINHLMNVSHKILLEKNQDVIHKKIHQVSYFRYKGIFIVDRLNNFLLSAAMNSKTFDLEVLSLQAFMSNKELHHRVQDGFYHIVIVDNQSMSKIDSKNFFEACIHTTMIIELIEPNRIPNLNTDHNYIEMHELIDFDNNIFKKWRHYVDQVITKNIKNSSSFLILLIDSDKNSREALHQLFAMQKLVKIKTAKNATEAIAMVSASVFDLIIVELLLEDCLGLELVRSIRIIQHESRFLACPIFLNSLYDILSNDYNLYGIDKVYIKPHIAQNMEEIISRYVYNDS